MADERDRRIAATLQRALLPRQLPNIVGVSLAAHVAPGAGGTRVGGGLVRTRSRCRAGGSGLVVGDVAGHGVDAAALDGGDCARSRAYALEGHGTVALVELVMNMATTPRWAATS